MRLAGTKLAANHQYRGFGDQLYDLSGQRPSLDLNFANSKSLVDATTGQNLVTFTRASSGTYVDSQGVIKTATTNLLLRSEEFNDASWTKTRSSVTANAIAAPNGTLTGDKLIDSTDVSASHFISQSISFVSGTTYTVSIFAKQDEIRYLRLGFNATPFGTTQVVFFDLLNGVINSNPNALAASITDAGNGWWRLAVTATATSTASDLILISLSSNGTSISFTGTGTNGLYLWGAQLEQSSTVGEYIPTTSTINSAPRFDHSPTTGESLGLLVEEQRTNLSQQSDNFSDAYWVKTDCTITANESTAPDGTLTADLWTNTASPGTIQNSITKDTAIRTYTASLWVKGTMSQFTVTLDAGATSNRGRVQYNLSTNAVGSVFNEGTFTNTSGTLTPYLNGWVRLTLTTTTSTGTTIRLRPFFSGTGSTVRIWGAQVEEGAFPTSYIPTTTATVTRSADVASITGSNWSSWGSSTTGTYYLEASVTRSSASAAKVFLGASTSPAESYYLYQVQNQSDLRTFDSTSVLDTVNTISDGVTFKGAVAYSSSTLTRSLTLNGDLVAEGAFDGTYGSDLSIGSRIAGGAPTTGTIKRLTYFPVRLANEVLQRITQ